MSSVKAVTFTPSLFLTVRLYSPPGTPVDGRVTCRDVVVETIPAVAAASFNTEPWLRYNVGLLKFRPVIVTGRFALLKPDAGLIVEITGAVPGLDPSECVHYEDR